MKQFVIPFAFKDRKPFLLDRLLYVPNHYDQHKMPNKGFSISCFDKVHIEYCSGNGQWIFDQAKKHPTIAWIAVEKRFDRAKLIYQKMHKHNVSNLFLVLGDARPFTKYYLENTLVDEIFINFPDPWPKKKHAKNRLMQKEFLEDVVKVLRLKGVITFVSDDLPYVQEAAQLFVNEDIWEPAFDFPYYKNELEGFGTSFFDSLFRNKGQKIYYLRFFKGKLCKSVM